MSDRKPPAAEQKPQDVSDNRSVTGVRAPYHGPSERPQCKYPDSKRGDAKRNGDYQHKAYERCRRVGQSQPKPSEYKPEDVSQKPHNSRVRQQPLGRQTDTAINTSAPATTAANPACFKTAEKAWPGGD
jgi:hypothetical protein